MALKKSTHNRFFNPPSWSDHFLIPTDTTRFLSGVANADNAIKLHFSPNCPLVTPPPPKAHMMKINYTGAVFRETNEAGLEAIVRDNEGRVLASLAEKISLP